MQKKLSPWCKKAKIAMIQNDISVNDLAEELGCSRCYLWLKLPDDFFRQKPIKKLRKIAGGDTYTIIYLKMLLISLKNMAKLTRQQLAKALTTMSAK